MTYFVHQILKLQQKYINIALFLIFTAITGKGSTKIRRVSDYLWLGSELYVSFSAMSVCWTAGGAFALSKSFHKLSPDYAKMGRRGTEVRKERKCIYIAPFIYYVYLKALRHGSQSHSFTCKYTMPAVESSDSTGNSCI